MKELTKVFSGIEIPVEVVDENNIWFDVSGISSKYNKRIAKWKNTEAFKEYIKFVLKGTNLKETELIKQVGNQTKIHNKMFVNYARYISAEFSYRADEIIMDILLGEKHLCDAKFVQLEEQLKISQKQTKEAKRKNHAFPRGNGFETVTRIIEDHNANITPHDFNTELVKRGILEAFELPKTYYKAPKMSGVIPLVHVDTAISILDDMKILRGVAYMDTHKQFDF